MTESLDGQVATAMGLPRRYRLLHCHPPDLAVIRDYRRQRARGLRFGSSDSALERVETVFKSIIDVMNVYGTYVSEVQAKNDLQLVG